MRQEMATIGIMTRPSVVAELPFGFEIQASAVETETRRCENDTNRAPTAIACFEMVAAPVGLATEGMRHIENGPRADGPTCV